MINTETSKDRIPFWRRAVLLLLGLAIFGLLIHWGGTDSLNKLAQPDPFWLVSGMLGVALMLFIFAARWGILVNRVMGKRIVGPHKYYFYSLSSLLVSLFMPQTVSMVATRAAALNQIESVPLGKSLLSIAFDKLFDGFIMLIFMWPGLLFVLDVITLSDAMIISLGEIILFSILIITSHTLWMGLARRFISVGATLFKHIPLLQHVGQRIDSLENWDMLDRRVVIQAYWLTIFGQIVMATCTWMFALAVGLEISFMAASIGIALAQASMLLAITPGGLGTSEAAWYIALSGADIAPETIVTFLVANRLFQTTTMVIAWLVVYLITIVLRE